MLRPDDPVTPPDPKGAYDLLNQARALAKGPALIATLRLELARAAQAAGNHPQAVADFQEYLKDPKAPERAWPPGTGWASRSSTLGQFAEAQGDLGRPRDRAGEGPRAWRRGSAPKARCTSWR